MATNNVRVVGYLPPAYHLKLQQYTESESITESAAIVKIIKQFFDEPKVVEATPEKGDEITELKANVAQLQQRLTAEEGETWGQGDKGKDQYSPPINGFKPPTSVVENQKNLFRSRGVRRNKTSVFQAPLFIYGVVPLSPQPKCPLVLFGDRLRQRCKSQ